MNTEQVIVFKDGYCLIVKRATGRTNEQGQVFTDEVPDSAVLGSFWALPEKDKIKSMTAGWVKTETTTTRELNCTQIIEIIKANLGKHCSFELNKRKIEGTLLKVLSNDDIKPDPSSDATHNSHLLSASANTSSSAKQTTYSRVTGSLFLLRSEFGDLIIPANQVQNLMIQQMNSTWEQTVTEKKQHKRLTMQFDNANQDVTINLMYFRPGVRWIPTYRVELTDEPSQLKTHNEASDHGIIAKQANIMMQGEILNEAEDLIDVPFHVVVGVPNFRFRSIPSPLILEKQLTNLLQQAAPAIMGNGFKTQMLSNTLYSQRSGEVRHHTGRAQPANATTELPDELTTSAGNDLFVYKLDRMSLKRGERASVTILKTTAAYRDIYTWDAHVTHNTETYAATSADAAAPLVLTKNRIWRQIELINQTEIPWTTGAVMFMDGYQPLAQELLTYTSPGGKCRVPVTVSVDIRGKLEDRETERKLKALRWRHNDYAKVLGKINLEVYNLKQEPIVMEMRLQFGGKAKTVSNDGKITLKSWNASDWHNRRGDAINNSSLVTWSQIVKPNEPFKPETDYEFWVQY